MRTRWIIAAAAIAIAVGVAVALLTREGSGLSSGGELVTKRTQAEKVMDAANKGQVEALTQKLGLKNIASSKIDSCSINDGTLSGNEWSSGCRLTYTDGFSITSPLEKDALTWFQGKYGKTTTEVDIAVSNYLYSHQLMDPWRPSCERLARCSVTTPSFNVINTDQTYGDPLDYFIGGDEDHNYRSFDPAELDLTKIVWMRIDNEYFSKDLGCKKSLDALDCKQPRDTPITAPY